MKGPGLRGPVLIGLSAALAFFGGLAAWAALAPLESAAVAPGLLSVEGRSKAVAHLDGGVVSEVRVVEGDRVAEDQVLLVLDDAETGAAVARHEAALRSASALRARLEAERDGRDEVAFPEGLPREVARTQARIFAARTRSFENRAAIYRQRIAELREEAAGLDQLGEAQGRELALLDQEIEALRGLAEQGYAGRQRLLALERERARIEGDRARTRAQRARAGQRVGEAELLIGELGNERLREAAAGLREVEAEEAELGALLSAARSAHARARVRAPVSGVVVGLRPLAPGGVVRAGEGLMEIVPAAGRLGVRARIAPADRDSVRPGLRAEVRLTGLPYLRTPPVDAVLARISADRLVDPRTGEAYYEGWLELDSGGLDARLEPGMPAEALILTGARTALGYLLDPLAASVWRSLREE